MFLSKFNVFYHYLMLLLNDLLNGDECKMINTGSINMHKLLDVIGLLLTKYIYFNGYISERPRK